jgi:hypothetical protein
MYIDNDMTLWYDKHTNLFIDSNGFEITNIFRIITPNTLYLFKHRKENMFVYGVDGQPVELIYPGEEDEYEY